MLGSLLEGVDGKYEQLTLEKMPSRTKWEFMSVMLSAPCVLIVTRDEAVTLALAKVITAPYAQCLKPMLHCHPRTGREEYIHGRVSDFVALVTSPRRSNVSTLALHARLPFGSFFDILVGIRLRKRLMRRFRMCYMHVMRIDYPDDNCAGHVTRLLPRVDPHVLC